LPSHGPASSDQALRSSGLNDQAIEDVIGWVCILQFYAVLDQALGFKGLPQAVLNDVAEGTVQSKGYVPGFQYFVNMSETEAVGQKRA